jgi:heme-degrading monooxygenase HmoA
LGAKDRSSRLDDHAGKVIVYLVVWRFRPKAGHESDFERAYGPAGEWARLFRRADGYLGTELLRRSDNPGEYLTLDRWASRAAYEAFRSRWGDEYGELDRLLEGLTEEEALLGSFEALP